MKRYVEWFLRPMDELEEIMLENIAKRAGDVSDCCK